MARTLKKQGFALCALALLLSLLLPAPALADPYPTDVKAEPVDATTVRVTWGSNAWAQGYRVSREDAGTIADLPPDVTEYLDTGLEPFAVYTYRVASVVNGAEYWGGGVADVYAIAAPEGFTSVSWQEVLNAQQQLWVSFHLVWAPVEGSVNFEVFARVGDTGEYVAQNIETCDINTDIAFPAQSSATRYWFKVAVQAFKPLPLSTGTFDYLEVYGPFSPETVIEVPALTGLTLSVSTLGPLTALWTPFPLRPILTPYPYVTGDELPQLRTLTPQWKEKDVITPPLDLPSPSPTPAPAPGLLLPAKTARPPVIPTATPRLIEPIKIPLLPLPTSKPILIPRPAP